MTKNELMQTALNLKSLLTVIAAVDSDNKEALTELPNVAKIALEMAESLYCHVVDKEE